MEFAPNLRTKIERNFFWPKGNFVKSVPEEGLEERGHDVDVVPARVVQLEVVLAFVHLEDEKKNLSGSVFFTVKKIFLFSKRTRLFVAL
jgi:hypothetical protein